MPSGEDVGEHRALWDLLSDPSEWAAIGASHARAQEWAGVSRNAWAANTARRRQLARSVASTWEPENLVACSSMARALAEEQLAGRPRIPPRAVMCSSEVLTEETRARIRARGA
jgi:phenylacetate-coenzyme A ligase PaaK-like adenylate-forming protein